MQDDQAEHDAFLTEPHETAGASTRRRTGRRTNESPPTDRARASIVSAGMRDESVGFLPKAAIAAGGGDWLADETRAVVRTRLREMAVFYGLIFGMFVILGHFCWDFRPPRSRLRSGAPSSCSVGSRSTCRAGSRFRSQGFAFWSW